MPLTDKDLLDTPEQEVQPEMEVSAENFEEKAGAEAAGFGPMELGFTILLIAIVVAGFFFYKKKMAAKPVEDEEADLKESN